MKKAILPLFLFASLLSANTVQVSFESANPVVTVPMLGADEAGPYTMNVNGNSVLGMCMDDFRGVNGTWTATVTNVSSPDLSGTVLGNGNQSYSINGQTYTVSNNVVYDMEAYLFSELIQPSADRANLQLAAWSLMDANTLGKVVNASDVTVETDLLNAYTAATNSTPGFNPANYEILTDISGTNQEYIVATPTPEPSTCLLFGTGLLLAGAARFSRRRKPATATK